MWAEARGRSLSKDVIVSKAFDVMVEKGLEAVSLRRVATELGVSAPTLYWYIANKRELLDGVAELLLRRGRIMAGRAEDQVWWDWLEQRCRRMYQTMISVPGAPEIIAGNRPTPEMLADTDAALGTLVDAGFPIPEAQRVFHVLGGYVGGMAMEWHAEAARTDVSVDDSVLRQAIREPARYPNLAAGLSSGEYGQNGHHQGTFDYGLGLLMRGMRARHAELTGRRL